MTIYATAVRCTTHADCWNALAEDLERDSAVPHDYRLVHGSHDNAQRIAGKMAERMEQRYAPDPLGFRCKTCLGYHYYVTVPHVGPPVTECQTCQIKRQSAGGVPNDR